MTKTQQAAIDIIRANGGSVVRFNFGWDNGVKLNFRVVSSLVKMGYVKCIALPPRGPQQIVPVKYTLDS
jgi:hypothetical protein